MHISPDIRRYACLRGPQISKRFFGIKSPNNGTSFRTSMFHASFVENIGVNVDDSNDSDSDDEEVGIPKLINRFCNSGSDSSDDISDFDDDGDDVVAILTSDKEAIETLDHSKTKLTKRD